MPCATPSSPTPTWPTVPVDHMLDDAVIDKLVKRIDRKQRRPELGPVPQPAGSDTVCFSIVDEKGMVVSFINSLYGDFGSGIVTSQDRRHPAQPRRGLRARSRPPQLHRARQAADAHAGAGHGAEGRQARHGRSA